MENLKENISKRIENENGLDNLLSELIGVEYDTTEYNEKVGEGIDFDLIYDIEEDCFEALEKGEGKNYCQFHKAVFISDCEDIQSEEDLVDIVEAFLQN